MKRSLRLAPSNLPAACRQLQIDEIDSILLPSTGCIPSTDALSERLRDWHCIDIWILYSVFIYYQLLWLWFPFFCTQRSLPKRGIGKSTRSTNATPAKMICVLRRISLQQGLTPIKFVNCVLCAACIGIILMEQKKNKVFWRGCDVDEYSRSRWKKNLDEYIEGWRRLMRTGLWSSIYHSRIARELFPTNIVKTTTRKVLNIQTSGSSKKKRNLTSDVFQHT